jgi:hypothetical protein
MKKTLTIFFILVTIISIVPFQPVHAQQGSISFASGPTATLLSFSNGQGSISLEGKVTGPMNLIPSSLTLSVAFLTTLPDLSTFTGPYDVTSNNSNGQLFDNQLNFSVSETHSMTAGTNYYVVVRVTALLGGVGTAVVQEAALVTTPADNTNPNPTSTDGNLQGANQTCADGSTDCVEANYGYNQDFTLTSTIHNPLGVDFSILGFLKALFKNFVKLALPFLVLFTIYSGFLFVEARGNEEKLSIAKKNFLYVIIGALLILGAWTIATVLSGTVDQFEQAIRIINLV